MPAGFRPRAERHLNERVHHAPFGPSDPVADTRVDCRIWLRSSLF